MTSTGPGQTVFGGLIEQTRDFVGGGWPSPPTIVDTPRQTDADAIAGLQGTGKSEHDLKIVC